ncbi:MAG: glycosyltransferase family 4 protein, partial [Sphaerospermopsis sp. SIO1G2]|nr:glycosyltransferase family 4 protein [Sphaerospermopsis sp. SIO1G2]
HAITVPSKFLRARLAADFGCTVDRISVLPYGLQPTRFALKQAQTPPVTIGCFADEDVTYTVGMLRAALELEPILGGARVVIVVSQQSKRAAEAIVAADADRDRWQVIVGGAQTAEVLQHMDVVLYAVQQDTHPLTIVKAQLAGRPVIASAVGSVTELIDDRKNGLVVPVGNAAALASALSLIWDEAAYNRDLTTQARDTALQRNALDAVGKAWETLYRGVLRGSRSTTSDAQQVYRRLSVHGDDNEAEEKS